MTQTILTGIAIGIFPLLVLAAVFNKLTLSVLKGYVFALMWLQSWPMLYAILNSAMTFLCKAEWCTGGALGNFTDTAEILRSGFHCRVSFHDDPAIILDDGQGARWQDFSSVCTAISLPLLSVRPPVQQAVWLTVITPTATCRRRTLTASAGAATAPRRLVR